MNKAKIKKLSHKNLCSENSPTHNKYLTGTRLIAVKFIA